MRRLTLSYQVAPLIGELFLNAICDIPQIDAVGGLTLGADPIACAVLHQAIMKGYFYDAFIVRKNLKEHGTKKLIEGPDVSDKRVVILEDTATSGSSALAAARALKQFNAKILAIVSLLDRNSGAKAAIEAAGYDYRYIIHEKELSI